jgi:hypothetical protein
VHFEVLALRCRLELDRRATVQCVVTFPACVRESRECHARLFEVRGLSHLPGELPGDSRVLLALLRERNVLHEEGELAHRLLGDREVPSYQSVARHDRERRMLLHDFLEAIGHGGVLRGALRFAVATAPRRNRQPQ